MGRSYTPKYRLEMSVRQGDLLACWVVKHDGPATNTGLETYMERYISSLMSNGTNRHLGPNHIPNAARIIRQSDGQVIARWKDREMFRAIW